MQWNKTFEVGMRCLDEQHHHLHDLMVDLDRLAEAGDRDAMEGVLDELIRVTRYHFAVEADLMEVYGYPDRDRHLEEHTAFIHDVGRMREESGALVELRVHLFRWFGGHSTGADRHFVEHVQGARSILGEAEPPAGSVAA